MRGLVKNRGECGEFQHTAIFLLIDARHSRTTGNLYECYFKNRISRPQAAYSTLEGQQTALGSLRPIYVSVVG